MEARILTHTHTAGIRLRMFLMGIHSTTANTNTNIEAGLILPYTYNNANKTTAKEDTIQPRLHRTSPIYYITI